MSIRIRSRSIGTLIGGDLAVDIDHSADSIQVGDGTNLLGPFTLSGATYLMPVDVKSISGDIATATAQSDGSQKTQIVDASSNVGEFDDVGGEKALKVSVIASVGGGGGGTAATDSAAYTAGASQFTPIGGAYDDVAPDALAEGEMGMARVSSARSLHIKLQEIASSLAIPVTDNGGSLTIDNSNLDAALSTLATATKQDTIIGHLDGVEGLLTTIDADTGNLAGILTSLQALDNALTSVGTDSLDVSIQNASLAVTGTFWQATQPVSAASLPLPTGAATAANQSTANTALSAIQTAVETLDNAISGSEMQVDVVTLPGVGGDVANDAADSGNPVKVGGLAKNTNPTAVADGDRVNALYDLQGRQIVVPHAPRDLITSATGSTSSSTQSTMLSAQGAGIYTDLVYLVLSNSDTTEAVVVDIISNSTTVWQVAIAAGGGAVMDFSTIPLPANAANSAWEIDISSSLSSGNMYWSGLWVERTA